MLSLVCVRINSAVYSNMRTRAQSLNKYEKVRLRDALRHAAVLRQGGVCHRNQPAGPAGPGAHHRRRTGPAPGLSVPAQPGSRAPARHSAERQRGTRRPIAAGERTAPGTGTEAGRDGTGQRAAHRAVGAAAGSRKQLAESSAQAVEQAQNQARIREPGQRRASAKRRPSGRTRQRQDGNGRQRLPRQRAQRRPGHSPNRDRQPETTGDGPAGRQPAAQGSATEGPAGRATGQDGQDRRRRPRRHQRHGAGCARQLCRRRLVRESAPQETQKFASIGKKLDLQAFSQGFTDKINNRLQLPQAKLSAELDGAQQQLETAMLSKNEKESKALLAAAAKEKARSRCRTA